MKLFHEEFLLDSKDILVFIHIPKCGGSSVHRFMNQLFQTEYANVTPEELEQGLADQLRARRRIVSIGGHYPIGENPAMTLFPDRTPRYFSLVRDPVDRFISFYRYSTRSPRSTLRREMPDIADYSLREFVRFAQENKVYRPNMQTRMLTGHRNFDEHAPDFLRRHYVALMPVEMSQILFEKLADHFGQQEYLNSRENVSPETEEPRLDTEMLHYIYSTNLEDLKLYNFVKMWFARSVINAMKK